MRLADFIQQNRDIILSEWDTFAASALPAAARMDAPTLRDHGAEILLAIAEELQTPPQSPSEQDQNGKGLAHATPNAPNSAAQTHAVLRAKGGFNIVQLASEYRALRASVLRLWALAVSPHGIGWSKAFEDMTRFNGAIDQAVAESVDLFSREVERGRNLFLGVLGHDLRNPLQTIQTTADLLGKMHTDPFVLKAAARLIRSGSRMKTMLDDLSDYNRTTLSAGIYIAATETDLANVCAAEIDDLCSIEEQQLIEFEVDGNVQGFWDAERLQQLLCNLLSNAFVYGDRGAPVKVRLTGIESEVHLAVINRGPMIPQSALPHLFDPLKRGLAETGPSASTHLGLGLFIIKEIAKAHGGDVRVSSDEDETVFTVRLPRRA